MTRQTLAPQLDYFRKVLAVTRRLVEQFPAEKVSLKPTTDVRSAADIICHNYQFLREAADSVAAGKDFGNSGDPKITDKSALLKFMDEAAEHFVNAFSNATDAQLSAAIEINGNKYPAWKYFVWANDEHWHHRGQLTVYLRLLGIEPVNIYDMQ